MCVHACYLGQAGPRWGSYYTGEPGSTRQSGQVRAGFCRSCDLARTRWSSPSDAPALRHSQSATRNTAVPYSAHPSHKNGPRTHIRALLEAVSSRCLFRRREQVCRLAKNTGWVLFKKTSRHIAAACNATHSWFRGCWYNFQYFLYFFF